MEIEQIFSDFEFLDDWEDRYRYIIELGNKLESYPAEQKTAETKVQGCVSQVWVTSKIIKSNDGDKSLLYFKGDSDAHIVRGLIAIVFGIYSGKTAEEIIKTDHQMIFDKLGLKDHISPQRSNGLIAMVKRIRADAENLLKAA